MPDPLTLCLMCLAALQLLAPVLIVVWRCLRVDGTTRVISEKPSHELREAHLRADCS